MNEQPPAISDAGAVLEVLAVLIAHQSPEWIERAHRTLAELNLAVAAGEADLPERQFQALRQLLAVVEAVRPMPEDRPHCSPAPSLAGVRALLAAFARVDKP